MGRVRMERGKEGGRSFPPALQGGSSRSAPGMLCADAVCADAVSAVPSLWLRGWTPIHSLATIDLRPFTGSIFASETQG